jgi:Ca-activated chloride channel homolog
MPLSVFSSPRTHLVPYTPPINSSGAELVTTDGRSLPLTGAKLRAEAKGGIARLVLEQTFENRYAETLQVTYRMPLPADGAVSGYAFDIADRTIKGRVDKKQAAREQFERAVAEGKTAALLEQNRDDIFTQEIGNLPANETLIARITIDQKLAWLPEGEWELRFPTVIGPRYVGADATEKDSRDTVVAVDPGGISTRIQIAIAIGDTLIAGRRPSSTSHAIKKDADGMIELAVDAALDRDIVLRWPVATREVGLALDVARRGDRSYGLLTIVPPAREAKPVAIPRDLILLLDTSGSMGGAPLDNAKQVVAMLIDSLSDADRLEMIEFSTEPRRWRKEPVVATTEVKREAIAWVRKLEANGGTEMARAVRQALESLRPGAQRQVVLVSDGYVGGEQQIVKLLHENLPTSCRMHVLGVGYAPNRSLALALARAGRGAEVQAGSDEDVERATKRLLDRTKAPMLTNVEISGSALVHAAPEHIPDVFEGAPLVAALELSPEGGELVVRGEIAGASGDPYRSAPEAWIQKITVPPKRDGEGNQAIVALYAREHVADLEVHWTIGDEAKIDREIEAAGVRYQISTRLTSWVAIDESRRIDPHVPSRHEVVPQNVPHGTSAASFGLRSTVIGAPMRMAKMMAGGAAMAMPPANMQSAASYRSSEMLAGKVGGPMNAMAAGPMKSRARVWTFVLLLALIVGFLVWWLVL